MIQASLWKTPRYQVNSHQTRRSTRYGVAVLFTYVVQISFASQSRISETDGGATTLGTNLTWTQSEERLAQIPTTSLYSKGGFSSIITNTAALRSQNQSLALEQETNLRTGGLPAVSRVSIHIETTPGVSRNTATTVRNRQVNTSFTPATTVRYRQVNTSFTPATTVRNRQVNTSFAPATTVRNRQVNTSFTPATKGRYRQVNTSFTPATTVRNGQVNTSFAPATTVRNRQVNTSFTPVTTVRYRQVNTSFTPATTVRYRQVNTSFTPASHLFTNQTPALPPLSHGSLNLSDHVVLTPALLETCLLNNDRWRFSATSGSIVLKDLSFSLQQLHRYAKDPHFLRCQVRIQVPEGRLLSVQVLNVSCDRRESHSFCIHENLPTGHRLLSFWSVNFCHVQKSNITVFTTAYTSVDFTFSLFLSRVPYGFDQFAINISFTSLPEDHQTLQVLMTSLRNGYVSTPNWGRFTSYFLGMNTWTSVTIPGGYDVMVSLPFIDCLELRTCLSASHLALYERPKSKRLAVFCRKRSSPAVYSSRSGLLYVRFVSRRRSTGFKLLFSLSPRATLLVQRPDGTWNCSGQRWSEFRQHFPCNLRADCWGMEDEAQCSYTTPVCGEGRLAAAGSCYVYVSPKSDVQSVSHQETRMSWKMAEEQCRMLGGHLASLNSYREMLDVGQLLYDKGNNFHVFIGMTPTRTSLPALYRYMWNTLDETINHFTGCIFPHYVCPKRDFQGAAFSNDDDIYSLSRDCLPKQTGALCEVPAADRTDTTSATHSERSPSAPRLPVIDQDQNEALWNETAYLRCSAGHVTHSFLACDVRSACWARDVSASVFCPAPVEPLPPALPCDNGVQHVPYTLLCDHHADCDDDSDEDFCVFSHCDVITQFQCLDGTCVPFSVRCDVVVHCSDASDEHSCWFSGDFGPQPEHFRCNSRLQLPPAILLFDGRGRSQTRSLTQRLSLNGTIVTGSLVNATVVSVTLIGQTLVRGSGVKEKAVSGIVALGTLVSGVLVNRTLEDGTALNSEVLASGTSVSGSLVSGFFVQGASQQMTRVNVTLLNSTLVSGTSSCPDTHYQCADDGYCVPVFTRCNHVYDCPGREDEADCQDYQCPGFYRCRGTSVCVHRDHLCDGVLQCLHNDDELLCDLTCPYGCTCYGLAFFCSRMTPVYLDTRLRYLDASGSGRDVGSLVNNTLLVYLSLARCQLTSWAPVTLPNLRTVDLSVNNVTQITGHLFHHLPNLRDLILAHNPLSSVFVSDVRTAQSVPDLQSLHLTGVVLSEFHVTLLEVFPKLNTLNLSGCRVDRMLGDGFHILKQLRVLDLRGCPMTYFPKDVFHGLHELRAVYADNYRLCCPAVLPGGFYTSNCESPSDEVSSCEALLRSTFFRICLCLFAVLACVGNLSSIFFRIKVNKVRRRTGFEIFVLNLCASDLLMGVYLSIIGVADRLYVGTYLWHDVSWRHSSACHVAGFLSLLSSEVSAFIICLITLDRFLVLRFPFSRLRFSPLTAVLACGTAWLVCFVIAALPLMPMTSHWRFYGRTGICIPLPVTRAEFEGHGYSFHVMIVLNFVLFIIIALGQLLIFSAVQRHRMPAIGDTDGVMRKDQTLARRLVTVAMTDFLCWFPIGMVGMMAANGSHVPVEVNLAMAIFVLPLNSAINPFLYTLNISLEKLRLSRERRLKQYLLSERNAQDAFTGNLARPSPVTWPALHR